MKENVNQKSFTRLKLEEAHFFLKKMEDNVNLESEFNYYLNAFITSARAVKWIMNKEYSHIKGWKEWNNELSKRVDNKEILQMISKIRNISQKERPLIANKEYIIPIPDDLELKEDIMYNITLRKIENPNKAEILKQNLKTGPNSFIARIEILRSIDEIDDNVMNICKDYYDFLENIVIQCENLFKNNK